MNEIICFALASGVIMFFCLASKKTKKMALWVAIIWASILIISHREAEDYNDPSKCGKELKRVLDQRGMTFAEFGVIMEKRSPLEQGGDYLFLSATVIVICAIAFSGRLEDDREDIKYVKQIRYQCLALVVVTTLYFFSLILGIQLMLLPWIKRKKLLINQPDQVMAV